MARTFLLGVATLATLVTVVWPVGSAGQGNRATVLSIGDGDTIRVRQGGRANTVRLACIDAPETAQSPYGQQARTSLQRRLPIGREVVLDVKTTDRYGRTVAEVISEININLAMVEDGLAFAYRQYLGGCNAKAYLDAEGQASRAWLGVWQVQGGITRPWDFRRGRRSAAILDGTTPGGCQATLKTEPPCYCRCTHREWFMGAPLLRPTAQTARLKPPDRGVALPRQRSAAHNPKRQAAEPRVGDQALGFPVAAASRIAESSLCISGISQKCRGN